MRNFIDEIEEEMCKGEDFVTLRLNKFYEFLAFMEDWDNTSVKQNKGDKVNSLKDKLDKRIFDSIEDINKTFGVDLELPKKVPEGADIICYNIVDLYRVELFMYFKETPHELLGYTGGEWGHSGSISIEEEIKWDSESCSNSYIYLRLAQKHIKDKFTLERLLGVETTGGYVTNILNDQFVLLSSSNVYWYSINLLKYYISDDSDETVSFNEYVKLFYDVEGVL